MKFTIACNSARTRGAIGVFHPVEVVIEAKDRDEAEELFREQYETNSPPVIIGAS